MKTKIKIFIVALIVISVLIVPTSSVAFAEEIVYPFDSITIVSAYHFGVLCTDEPTSESYLYGYVSAGENIKVYVGELEFVNGSNTSQSRIAILTNEAGDDICAWIINSAYLDQSTNIYTCEYSSHITIDPAVGVAKGEDFLYNTIITKDRDTNECTFSATNWDGTVYCEYPMISGTYEEETDLSIVISAYEEVGG